jgi:hypothetical protein
MTTNFGQLNLHFLGENISKIRTSVPGSNQTQAWNFLNANFYKKINFKKKIQKILLVRKRKVPTKHFFRQPIIN